VISIILAALGMTADGVAEGLYAVKHGFSARAASVGYALGAVVAFLGNVVTPITFTVESIAIATRTATSRPQIFYIVVLSAIPSIALGALGLYSTLVGLLDPAVIAGTIGGVGIILTGVGIDYLKARPLVAGASTIVGLGAWFLFQDLVPVIIGGVAAGTLVARVVPERFQPGAAAADEDRGETEGGEEEDGDRFRPIPFRLGDILSKPVILGAFAVFSLRTGAVVSYDTVNADLAGTDPTLDATTLMAGLSSLASGLLGGPPLETTPAPMASASDPVLSTVLFMALMAAVTGLGLVTRVGRFVPLQAIAGFLIVLGIPVIMPEQLPTALEAPLAGGTALAVTALTNPFYGILAGELVALLVELGIASASG
jgi:adenine/guanine/hypoxanthine permease